MCYIVTRREYVNTFLIETNTVLAVNVNVEVKRIYFINGEQFQQFDNSAFILYYIVE